MKLFSLFLGAVLFSSGKRDIRSNNTATAARTRIIRFRICQPDRSAGDSGVERISFATFPPNFCTPEIPIPSVKLKKFVKKAGVIKSSGVITFTVVDIIVDAPKLKIILTISIV